MCFMVNVLVSHMSLQCRTRLKTRSRIKRFSFEHCSAQYPAQQQQHSRPHFFYRHKKEALDPANTAQETKDAALTNASNIGTALMSTNSYRALVIAWVVGLFPVVLSIASKLEK